MTHSAPALNPQNVDFDMVREAVRILRSKGIIAFPTDTVYGLGVDPLDREALARLFELKGRPSDRPIPLLLGSMSQVEQVAASFPSTAKRLAARFWPGALTLVVPAQSTVPDQVTAKTGTVGIRVCDHPLPRAISLATGRPITGTSANFSGEPPFTECEDVKQALGGRVDLVLPGTCGGQRPSTVVDCTQPSLRIVRHGAIAESDITDALS